MADNSPLIGLALVVSGVITSIIGFGLVVGVPLIVIGLAISILGLYTDHLTRAFAIG